MEVLGGRMEPVFRVLASLPGVGPFLGYLLACDLTYTGLVSYGESDWVMPHTGSRAALARFLGEPVGVRSAQRLLWGLLERSEEALNSRGFEAPSFSSRGLLEPQEVSPVLSPELVSLRALEDGLCETERYWRIREGRTRTRRYRPPAVAAPRIGRARPRASRA